MPADGRRAQAGECKHALPRGAEGDGRGGQVRDVSRFGWRSAELCTVSSSAIEQLEAVRPGSDGASSLGSRRAPATTAASGNQGSTPPASLKGTLGQQLVGADIITPQQLDQ